MLVIFAIIFGAVALDQLTKWLTVIYLDYKETVPLWQDVFHFTYEQNTGAAFSIFNEENQRWIFMTFSTVAIIGLLVYLLFFKPKDRMVRITLSMIVGGGIGNMIDRLSLGYVVDFIDVRLINFPVFNIADCFVSIGSFLLMGYMMWDMIRESRAEKRAKVLPTDTDPLASEEQEDGTGLE